MKPLLKKQAVVDGRKVDFVFLQDEDFRTLMTGDYKEFIKEHQQGSIAIALVSCASYNSIISDEINCAIPQLMELYPSKR